MDKLTANKFWIGVGATGLLLAGLVFWLVYQPMSALSDGQRKLESSIKKLEKPLKTGFLATEEYKAYLEAKNADEVAALERGIDHYDALGKRFQEYFDDALVPGDFSGFGARYGDEFKLLISAYREKFKIDAVPADAPGASSSGARGELVVPPVVAHKPATQLEEDRLGVAMKEFWMAQAVIQTCEKLNLGGLQSVEFPARDAEHKDSAETHTWRAVVVGIDLPFSQAENFVAELLSGDRVRFRVQRLDIEKAAALVALHKDLVIVADFEHYATAEAKAYGDPDVAPEPAVQMRLELDALDWKGMKVEDPKSDDKTTSKRSKRRNKRDRK